MRANDDPIVNALLMRKLGSVAERMGNPKASIRWFGRVLNEIPERATSTDWLSARADIRLAEAAVRSRQGDNQRCLALSSAALDDAERAGDERAEALALERMHVARVFLRSPDVDSSGSRAAEAHRELNDRVGLARTLTNMGIEAYFAGDWSTASEWYLESLEAATGAGSIVPAATAAINSAEILSDQGDWTRALELFDGAIRNYEAVGYSPGIAAATLFAGVAAMRAGDLDGARIRFATARTLLVDLEMAEWIDDLECRQLELDLLAGEASVERCRALLTRFTPEHPFTNRVLRSLGLSEFVAGDSAAARTALDSSLELSSAASYELALTLRALLQIEPDSPEASGWRAESSEIFRRLGVKRPPPLLDAELLVSSGT